MNEMTYDTLNNFDFYTQTVTSNVDEDYIYCVLKCEREEIE